MRLNGLVFATSLFRKNNIPTSQVCSTRALRDDRTYSYYTTTYHKNLNLPSPALHTVQTTLPTAFTIYLNDVYEEI